MFRKFLVILLDNALRDVLDVGGIENIGFCLPDDEGFQIIPADILFPAGMIFFAVVAGIVIVDDASMGFPGFTDHGRAADSAEGFSLQQVGNLCLA